MKIIVPAFTGVNKFLAPQRIQDTEAVEARDCDFRNGDLRGFFGAQATGASVTPNAGGMTLYEYDASRTIAVAGFYRAARSPTVDDPDKRLFFSKETDPNWYPGIVDTTMVSAGVNGVAVLTGLKRLGVPAPAAPGFPDYEEASGEIASITFQAKKQSNSSADFQSFLTTVNDVSLTTGDKVLVDVAGLDAGPWTVTVNSADKKKVILNKSGLDYLSVVKLSLHKDNDAPASFPGLWVRDTTTGFAQGDQLVLNYRDGAPNSGTYPPPTGTTWGAVPFRIFYVGLQSGTSFQLEWLDGGGNRVPVPMGTTRTDNAIDTAGKIQIARVAKADNPITDNGGANGPDTTITWDITPLNGINYQNVVCAVPAGGAAAWTDAAVADVVQERAYRATWVNKYGDESAPSPATKTMTLAPGTAVTFTAAMLPTAVDANYADIVKIRLYRTNAMGQWQLVTTEEDAANTITLAEAVGGFTFVDSRPDGALGVILSTEGWIVPKQGTRGLTGIPNGVIVGFYGKTVCAAVPYAPYAWPLKYRQVADADIVGLIGTAAGVAILTTKMPYLLAGTDPASWSMVKLEKPQSCVAAESIVDMGDYGMYASPDGLVAISGADVQVVTEKLLTRDQWQAYNPASIIAGYGEGRYIASYLDGGTRKGFVFDPVTGTFSDLTLPALAFYNDLSTDTLKYIDTSGNIQAWNRGTTRTAFYWKSKLFQAPRPCNFGAAQILMEDYSKTAPTQLYVDKDNNNTLDALFTAPIAPTRSDPFRLPGGYLSKDYQIEITGGAGAVIQALGMATAMGELAEAP